ncbi:uncharacterized protein LOC120905096 isoform X1 [Anopheles arabiensis]|uniref:uncharacterized protein LOC120905096 isoform X1 n=1 Tax=Anopheles arabiensis TaxID=7173 RepID=UPI001AAD6F5A|nr:uncharacterized protein LOC120905096 isoform X1 [Anopheles arabiensis]XP_040171730.1 uncharacterized protein LOC120905096 isoform X1 [Anopheles arabiensis]
MYAAAGGASLASRQARKKQAQQNTKNKATNQQILREKLAAKAATTPTKSKHFHQLPASYLRAPHQHHRKLSAGYTSIPGAEQQPPAAAPPMHHRFADHPCASYTGPAAVTPSAAHHAHGGPGHLGHAHHHHHHHHHVGGAAGVPGHPCHLHGAAGGPSGHPPASGASFPPMPKPTGFREYDRLVRRQQLTKSATATLPLVSQAQDTPPQTPEQTLGGFGEPAHPHHHPQQLLLLEQQQHHHHSQQHLDKLGQDDQDEEEHELEEEGEEEAGDADALTQPLTLQIPNDPIIITPATPQATPPGRLGLKPLVLTDDEEVRPLASPAPGALERKCSVYRARKYDDPFEERHYNATTISSAQHHPYQPDDVFFPPAGGSMPNGGGHSTTTTTPGHQQGQLAKWDSEYYCCECDHRQYGVCTCDQFECAQGRAAWLERGRRCSVQETPASCHRRWVKRNRIQDSSLGGSSDDEDLLGVLRGPSSFANAFLYVGLGTIAIGLVIAFVGTGEKGFKTVELRLIGPSLIGLGLLCCTLRILFCICPSHCISSSRRARDKKNAKIDADHRTSLLRGDSKRVSIARGPHIPTKQPQIYPKSIVKTKTYEGVEALRQIATTSLFLQNEQKVSSNRIVPIIKEPEKLEEPPLELKKLESRKDEAAIVSISDGEDDSHRKQAAAQHHASDTQVIDLTGEDQDDEQSHSPSSGTSHQRKDSKLRRQRTSVHQQKPARELQSSAYSGAAGHNTAPSEPSSLLMETSLMIIGPTPLSSPTKAANATPPTRTPGGTLTVPTLSANGSAVHGAGQSGNKTATSSTTPGNLLTLPAAAATASSTAGSAGGPTVSFAGSTLLPGQLSPLPSTSYLPSSSVAGGYRSSSTSSPLPGFMPSSVSPHYHSNSSSSSSNYIYSPPPFTQHAEPTAHGTNTITTAASTTLLHAPSVSSNKTEPELVLSPAKLGQ